MKRLALGAGVAALAAVFLRRPFTKLFESIRAKTKLGLNRLTKEELYRQAQEADIPGRSEMNKDQLVKALKEH
jgi:Rho termination factor-like protein